jgi:hypothetical protein
MRILPPRAPSLPIPRMSAAVHLATWRLTRSVTKQDACYKAGAKGRPAEGEIGKRRADQHRCNLDGAADIPEESVEFVLTLDPERAGYAHFCRHLKGMRQCRPHYQRDWENRCDVHGGQRHIATSLGFEDQPQYASRQSVHPAKAALQACDCTMRLVRGIGYPVQRPTRPRNSGWSSARTIVTTFAALSWEKPQTRST